jgi:murein DD-endopeptidase MepM/ murein hydrolase activator NlpD
MSTTAPESPPIHPALRRAGKTLLVVALLVATAALIWNLPFMAWPRTLWQLSQMPLPTALPVPVEGVAARDIAPTFGAPRSGDAIHDGIDIFAARGTPVVSATRGVVLSVSETGVGGKQIWVIGPGRERHYYAHLDAWAEGLKARDILAPGQLLGRVGNSGNARGAPTHLHYGIYGEGGALDPLPRLRAGAVSSNQSTR